MGYCKDCRWCYSKGTTFGWRYCCSYFNPERFVEAYGSCNNFYQQPTPENSGYTSGGGSKGGCYLTSACVEYLGKADDCEELTLLRKFRDGYMNLTEGGARLVGEYYEIAPKIVERIEASGKQSEYYGYIYEVVTGCVANIKVGQNEAAQKAYVGMTRKLKSELL